MVQVCDCSLMQVQFSYLERAAFYTNTLKAKKEEGKNDIRNFIHFLTTFLSLSRLTPPSLCTPISHNDPLTPSRRSQAHGPFYHPTEHIGAVWSSIITDCSSVCLSA